MIINNVQYYPNSKVVGLVHKSPKIVRRAVEPRRRKLTHAIISPAEFPGKIGHRHDFKHGDSKPGKLFQLSGCSSPGAVLRERPDVHFVNYGSLPGDASPFLISPNE